MKHPRATALLVVLAAAFPVVAAAQMLPRPGAISQRSPSSTRSAACHGADGNCPLSANPQSRRPACELPVQAVVRLQGRRKNAVMSGMVAALSDDDLRNLAAYFAAQKVSPTWPKTATSSPPGRTYRGGDSETGVPACSGCLHSPTAQGFQLSIRGSRDSTANTPAPNCSTSAVASAPTIPNAMMRTIASRLTDKEMAALADYICGLR